MKRTPNIRSDKGSPTNRPNSPSARSKNSASKFRKCKSQSLILSGIVPSSQQCPDTGARERRTRQQLSVPVQPEHRRQALPCDELDGEMKYGNTTGDFITRSSVAAKNKPPTGVKCEDYLGHDGKPQSCSVTAAGHDMHLNSNEKDLDTFPIVQDEQHRRAVNFPIEQHYPCAVMSGSSTEFDTSWSSWSSDYSDKKHKHLSKSNTSLSDNKVSNAYLMLTVKRQLTSPMIQSKPTKEPLATRGSPTRRISSPRKKQNSCDKASTLRPMKSSDKPVSRKTHSVSPQKPICRKPTVGEKQNGSDKMQSPFRNISSIGQHRKTLECLSSSAEKNTLKLNNSAKANESQEMSRRGSPDIIKTNTAAKSLSGISKQLAKHSLKYVSPNRKGSPSLTEQAKIKPLQERSKSCIPKDIHLTTHTNCISRNSASRGNNLNRLKQMKTNRSDRSTDSGYQESVSRATIDWLSTWGKTQNSGTKGAILLHCASHETNYHFGRMIGHTETLVYSGGGENHSESFIHAPNSGDGALQTPADSNASETFFPFSLDLRTENLISQSLATTDTALRNFDEREPETSFALEHITEEEISKLTTHDTTLSSMILDDHKVSEEGTIFGRTDQDIEVEQRAGVSLETYNLSDTKSVISDMIENSDTTDVTTDWDATVTSVSESNKKTATPLRFEMPVEKVSSSKTNRSPLEKSRPLSPERCLHLPPKSKKAKKSESKVESEASQNSLKKANDSALNKPGQLSRISQTDLTLLPIRGFNSNTRRTVEINYDLITMTESRSARTSFKQITLSSSALNPTKRSQSEPPPIADRCSRGECQLPHFDTAGSSNIGPVDVNTPYRRCVRKSSSVAEPSAQSASHQSTPSVVSAAGIVFNVRIPEPKMMYLSLIIVLIMCFTLAHLMVYRVLGL